MRGRPTLKNCNINYLEMYLWNGLLVRQIMPLNKDFYDIPSQNVDLSKVTSFLTLIDCGLKQGRLLQLKITPLLVFDPTISNKVLSKV